MIKRVTDAKIEALVKQAVAAAGAAAGGPLETIHERYSGALGAGIKAAVNPLVREMLTTLHHEADFLQVTPNLRVHTPNGNSTVPFHSDTLYGHSHEEINYWLALTPVSGANSLWMVPNEFTEDLHERLRGGLSLQEFEALARSKAAPIESATPGLFTFCCSQIHGSVLNTTPATRVSLDFRVLPQGATPNVKKFGYFKPAWLPPLPCPLAKGTVVTTVASLDLPTPVYFQRHQMQRFHAQEGNRELVEFHNMKHAPTLEDAMRRGPVIAYSIKQVKRPMQVEHPVGFADEGVWFTKETQWAFERLRGSV